MKKNGARMSPCKTPTKIIMVQLLHLALVTLALCFHAWQQSWRLYYLVENAVSFENHKHLSTMNGIKGLKSINFMVMKAGSYLFSDQQFQRSFLMQECIYRLGIHYLAYAEAVFRLVKFRSCSSCFQFCNQILLEWKKSNLNSGNF